MTLPGGMTISRDGLPPGPPEPGERTLLVSGPRLQGEPLDQRRIVVLATLWTGVALVAMLVVAFGLGPFFQLRSQHVLLEDYRSRVDQAANEAFGLPGVQKPTKAPEIGTS